MSLAVREYLSAAVAPEVVAHHLQGVLSHRELEVAQLALAGLPTTEVARRLFVTVNTVKTHIRHILRKTGAHSRHDLLRRVVEAEVLGRPVRIGRTDAPRQGAPGVQDAAEPRGGLPDAAKSGCAPAAQDARREQGTPGRQAAVEQGSRRPTAAGQQRMPAVQLAPSDRDEPDKQAAGAQAVATQAPVAPDSQIAPDPQGASGLRTAPARESAPARPGGPVAPEPAGGSDRRLVAQRPASDRLLPARDAVTGLLTRAAFRQRAAEVVDSLPSPGLSVVWLEVEGRLLLPAPDRVAADLAVAQALAETVRTPDLAIRWSDSEFLALLPGTDREVARAVTMRLALALGQWASASGCDLLFSLASASSAEGITSPEALVAAAQQRIGMCLKDIA